MPHILKLAGSKIWVYFIPYIVSISIIYFAAIPSSVEDACVPSPCGPNAECLDGVCNCIPEFRGDPYVGCRPECVLNADCPRDRACIRNKCLDACPGACALNALCTVIGHVPMCSCPANMTGNAFSQCTPLQGIWRSCYREIKIAFRFNAAKLSKAQSFVNDSRRFNALLCIRYATR